MIRGYDRWKLSTPPEYDLPTDCPRCGETLASDGRCPEPSGECAVCGVNVEDHPFELDACTRYEPDSRGCGWCPEDDLPDPDAKYDRQREG